MEQSESIKELSSALSKAQAELKAAEMSATNPFLKNKYAPLGEVIKASRAALSNNGLSLVQPVSSTESHIILTTQLMHSSGEWIRDTMTFPLGEARGKSLAQEAGSLITYMRRYGMSSMLGIYADADVDGEENKPSRETTQKEKAAPTTPPEMPGPAATDKTNGAADKQGKPAASMIAKVRALVEQAEALHIAFEWVDYNTISAPDLAAYGKALKEAIAKREEEEIPF